MLRALEHPGFRHRRAGLARVRAPASRVLTGETGAGKSILVDAIELLVGGKGDARWCARAPSAPSFRRNSTLRRTSCSHVARRARPRRRSRRLHPAKDHRPLRAARAASSTATPPRSRSCARRASSWSTSTASTSTSRCCAPAAQRELLDAHAGARGAGAARPPRLPRLEAPGRQIAAEAREELRAARGRARRAAGSSFVDLKKLGPREGEWERRQRRAHAAGARLEPARRRAVRARGAGRSRRRLPAAARRGGEPAARAVGARRRAWSRSSRCSSRPRRRRARRRASCATTLRASTSTRRRCARPRRASRRCTPRRASTACGPKSCRRSWPRLEQRLAELELAVDPEALRARSGGGPRALRRGGEEALARSGASGARSAVARRSPRRCSSSRWPAAGSRLR